MSPAGSAPTLDTRPSRIKRRSHDAELCADPMDEVRGALFSLMAAHGAPEIIEQFGIVCEKLGCSTAPVIHAAAMIEAQVQRARLARVSEAEAKISQRAEQGEAEAHP